MYRNVLIRWIMTYQVNSNIWHFKQLGSGVLLYSVYMGTGDIFLGVALRWSSNNPWDMYFLLLQSGQVKHTPQDCINEFIIQSLNPSIGSCNKQNHCTIEDFTGICLLPFTPSFRAINKGAFP